jgi:RNA polymerase sigma-70 factor (ECF subfamily)
MDTRREPLDADLFDRCWKVVWPVVYSLVGDRAHAEDAAQESLVRIFRAFDRFDSTRPLEPWVRKIATNVALSQLRRRRPELSLDESGPFEPDWHDADAESGEDVRTAVARLEPTRRAVVILHYWLDRPVREIAEILDLPLGTVASHLSRARDELRLSLEDRYVG